MTTPDPHPTLALDIPPIYVYAIQAGPQHHEIEIKTRDELEAQFKQVIPQLEPDNLEALVHLLYAKPGAVSCAEWSVTRLGTLVFVPDEPHPRHPGGRS